MNLNIDFDNNYYMEKANEVNDYKFIDINTLKLKDLFKSKKILLKIDFNHIQPNQYKKVLRKLLSIRQRAKLLNIGIGELRDKNIFLGYILNYDENNENQKNFIIAINAIFYNSKKERYNFIYDTVCNYLDSFFYGKNLCDFRNNRCRTGHRKENEKSQLNGCCYHGRIKWLGPISANIPCEYLLEDHTCGAKCISCKLFTCNYLRKKGVIFKIKDILLLDVFFNPIQKYYIKYMVFTPKEKILKRLLRF